MDHLRFWFDVAPYKGMIDYVAMDSKADGYDLYREFSRQPKIGLITFYREHMNKSKNRRQMIADIHESQHQQIYKEYGFRSEPIKGIVKAIFGLNSLLF
ncbi:MAG: hypothetical protein PVG35_10220 [Desulfobacterales bacterium]|jgi:hypothetical protein